MQTYDLTHPQKRVWYVEKLHSGMPVYNIGGYSRFNGDIKFELANKSINIFIEKNDGIRLRILEHGGKAVQYISEYTFKDIDFFDFSSCEKPEEALKKWQQDIMEKPFELLNSDLYYFAVYKTSDNNSGIFVKMHHIISDGWSVNIMSKQIFDVYNRLLNKEEIFTDIKPSYTEFIENERAYLASERFQKNKAFFDSKFQEMPEPIFNNVTRDIRGKRKAFHIENSLTNKIKEYCSNNRVSLNAFFVANVLVYLYRISQKRDIVIGTPVLNRSGRTEKNIFGMFTSSMPFRFYIENGKGFQELIKGVNDELKSFYFNQRYPYDLLVKDISARDALYQVCVNYYNTALENKVNGINVDFTELYNGSQLYPLEIIIKEWSGEGKLALEFDYKLGDFCERKIDSMFFSLEKMIGQVLEDDSVKAEKIEILSKEERDFQLSIFNSKNAVYPMDKTVIQLFEEQVKNTPDKTAIICGNENITYMELNIKANRLAEVLRSKGVTRETITALIVDHSIEAVIGILGILKAGGAYLPIDPLYTGQRRMYMLAKAKCRLIVTDCINNIDFDFDGEIIDLKSDEALCGEGLNQENINEPSDLAYVIYTSGSTGNPKGVMISHRGLVNYVWWAKKMYVKDENEAFALYSSFSFDLTVTSVFTPLISGCTIHVYSDNKDEYVLYRIMRENKVSVIKLTPSHMSLIKDLDNGHSSVRRLIVGGEDLKVSLAESTYKSFGTNMEIFNEYGPTETVVGCMIHKYDLVKDRGTSVPIGIPIDNVQIYILDEYLNLMPEGSIGEMYISGDGVAKGYLAEEELTAQKFLDNPFIPGKRMYKTGDVACFIDGRVIEYKGRSDQQLKINGYRIEPGEIESRILDLENVSEAVVINSKDDKGSICLCAYIVVSKGGNSDEIKKHLSRCLPEYMVPRHYFILDKIPLTKNGKVNIKLLPVPTAKDLNIEEYIAPKGDREKILIKHAEEILNANEIGMKNNFFNLGGDSIKAIQLAGKLNENGFLLRVKDVLSNPVFMDMALCIEESSRCKETASLEKTFKPSPIIKWFLSRDFTEQNYYNQSVLLDFKAELSKEDFEKIMDVLIKHHDSLRLNIDFNTGKLFFLEEQSAQIEAGYYDLSALGKQEQEALILKHCTDIKTSFDIEKGTLLKGCLFELGDKGRKVFLTAHHIAVDGVSWRILLEDFSILFKKLQSKSSLSLSHKTDSIQIWNTAMEKYFKAPGDKSEKYWKGVSGKKFSFPVDRPSVNNSMLFCDTLSFSIDKGMTSKLIFDTKKAYGTKPVELMASALGLSICEVSKNHEVVFLMEGHGREELLTNIDITRTTGWFTSIYPVKLNIEGCDLATQIKSIKDQLRQVPDNGMGFGFYRFEKKLDFEDENYIRFNYLGQMDGFKDELFNRSKEYTGLDSSPTNNMTALLDINAMMEDETLVVNITYSKNQFEDHTVSSFAAKFKDNLERIIEHCARKEITEYTVSDFELVEFSQDDLDGLLSDIET